MALFAATFHFFRARARKSKLEPLDHPSIHRFLLCSPFGLLAVEQDISTGPVTKNVPQEYLYRLSFR